MDTDRTITHLEILRAAELEIIRPYFKKGQQVLEIGGGNGWQASLIAGWGCDVFSIDLPDRSMPAEYFPVQDYDGQRFPFRNDQFDIVFSSNVLEHISNLPGMLSEITRVLAPEGMAIHLLPTSAWRFFTNLSYYPYLFNKYVFGSTQKAGGHSASQQSATINRSLLDLMKRGFIAPAHGEYPNAISELYYFSRQRWLRVFANGGFTLLQDFSARLFYTGYSIFPGISITSRRALASALGSACRVYIMKPGKHRSAGVNKCS